MQMLFSSDLHGDINLYEALLALAGERSSDAVIVGGDLLPRTAQRSSAIDEQRRFLERKLAPLLQHTQHQQPWLRVYLLPGNDDWLAAVRGIDELERAGLARALDGRVWPLSDGLFLAGYACVPLTPYSIKDFERRDEESLPMGYSFDMAYSSAGGTVEPISAPMFAAQPSIADDLACLAHQSDPAQTIYACHAPPYGTALDIRRGGKHVGSQALRSFIIRHQPRATLHGHIHEAPQISGRYSEYLGTTPIIAAGKQGSRLHAVAFDTTAIETTLWHSVYGNVEL